MATQSFSGHSPLLIRVFMFHFPWKICVRCQEIGTHKDHNSDFCHRWQEHSNKLRASNGNSSSLRSISLSTHQILFPQHCLRSLHNKHQECPPRVKPTSSGGIPILSMYAVRFVRESITTTLRAIVPTIITTVLVSPIVRQGICRLRIAIM